MKKVLYGTTALVAGVAFAGAAYAAPIELSIGGKQEIYFGVGGIDDDAANDAWANTGMTSDTELYFTGSTTLDNGITVNAIIQIEAEADNANDNADEQAIQFSGNFGTLQMGQRQGFAGSMAYDAPSAGGPILNDEYWGYDGGQVKFYNYYTGDDLGVSYVTPSFFGFTAAATYAPDAGGTDDAGFTEWNTVGNSQKDLYQFGLAFDNEFSGVGLHGDFQFGQRFGTGATATDTIYRGGVAVSYMGFEVGGSYGYTSEEDGSINQDEQAWLVGVSYQNGPYGVAFQYEDLWRQSTTDTWAIMFSGNYVLAPGIDIGAAVFHSDDDGGANANGGGFQADSTATGGFVGVGLSF